MQVFIYCEITPHVSGVHRIHHQEYIKLLLQPVVQVIVSEQQPSYNVAKLDLISIVINVVYVMGKFCAYCENRTRNIYVHSLSRK
jgi:hypothetical protein